MTSRDRQIEAQNYIDRIVAVSKQHGANTLPKTAQREAAQAAAAAFARIKPAK